MEMSVIVVKSRSRRKAIGMSRVMASELSALLLPHLYCGDSFSIVRHTNMPSDIGVLLIIQKPETTASYDSPS